jgi:hypothetical protein
LLAFRIFEPFMVHPKAQGQGANADKFLLDSGHEQSVLLPFQAILARAGGTRSRRRPVEAWSSIWFLSCHKNVSVKALLSASSLSSTFSLIAASSIPSYSSYQAISLLAFFGLAPMRKTP